jgi:alcohol dehydrogenase YqhD (iron-dependent ADH family)
MTTKWLWVNSTKVAFGVGAVKEHLSKFVKPGSKVLCTFGGGSIDANGARADTQAALDALKCTTAWEGGIVANPEYDRLIEIVSVVKSTKPDLLLAVGGGSVLDGTKFISVAATLAEDKDPWTAIMVTHDFPSTKIDVGSVLTLPATGSEWNSNFVISRRSIRGKLGSGAENTFPVFSLLDPTYTLTLPPRQVANGVFDGVTHVIDQFLTGEENPLMDAYWLATLKEFVDIGPEVVKAGSSIELRGRLVVACSFALNFVFTLGKEGCWAIHMIGHQLTALYGIDHGATLSIVAPTLLENQFEVRKALLAKSAEFVFGVTTGTVDEKARAFITKLSEFIKAINSPAVVSDVPGVVINPGDVDLLTDLVLQSVGGQPFGWKGLITKDVVKEVLTKVVV